MAKRPNKKHGIAVTGPWGPYPLDFWRSRSYASLSPHASKLVGDCMAALGPNAHGNGDLCLSHSVMRKRGWSSRETLGAAIRELEATKLLFQTRQGSRLDCSLWALTLYPLDCDLNKLDVRPGCYTTNDWRVAFPDADKPPTDDTPATWNRARKLKTVAPPRDDAAPKRPVAGRHAPSEQAENASIVPPRDETPSFSASNRPATGHLSRITICTRSKAKQGDQARAAAASPKAGASTAWTARVIHPKAADISAMKPPSSAELRDMLGSPAKPVRPPSIVAQHWVREVA